MQYSTELLYCVYVHSVTHLGLVTLLTAKLSDRGAWELNGLALLIKTLFSEIIEVDVFPYCP